MKRLFLLLLFCHYNLISQELNYAEYYKICYSAEYNVALGNKEMGWRLYNQAFVRFFPQIGNLNKAIELGKHLSKQDHSIESQLNLLIELKKYFFSDSLFVRTDMNKKKKKLLIKSFPYLNENDFMPLNLKQINNLLDLSKFLYADQTIRKIENSKCKDSLIMKVDEKIYEDFLTYIRVNGFPSQREYGMYSIYPYFLLLHYTVYHGVTPEIEKLLVEQINKGNFHPSMYARLIDRYRTWVTKQPQLYGEWIENEGLGEIYDIKNIDEGRSNIGLESFYEFCIKNNYIIPENYTIPEKYKK